MKRRTYLTYPEQPSGYVLNPCKGFLSVIVPIQRTNLVTNPSLELGTTGYTASGASIAQSTTRQYHGAYSLAITPTSAVSDGAYYAISLTSGTIYAASCKAWGVAGRKYKLSVATTGAVDLAAYRFTATGRWQWVWVYWLETSSTTRRVYLTKDSQSNTDVFYLDGLQVEAINAGETVSTYIDGDQTGLLPNQFPYPYYWTGTPHGSTSVRLATTRAGGYVLNLDRFRYRVLALAGLGLTTIANIASIPAAADGGSYQNTLARPRTFAVNGAFSATSLSHLDQLRSQLYDVIGPDSASPRQPVNLLYQAFDGQREISQFGTIAASYERGLEGVTQSLHGETAPITFTAYLPTIQAGESGVALPAMATFTNANNIVQRSAGGTWSAMGTGGSGATLGVQAFIQTIDKTLYATGDFTSMGGVANTARIASWNGSAWAALTTGLNGAGKALAVDPNGTTLYVGGDFTLAGGVANTVRIASWSGSAWSALSTGANGTVAALAFGPDGKLYAGGNFTTIGGVAINRIAKWDGAAWSALAVAGADATVATLAFGLDGKLYAGGSFTTIGGVTAGGIAYWDGSAWNAMGNTFTGTVAVNSIAVGANGAIYAGGNMDQTVSVWNGTAWTELGDLVGGNAYKVVFGPDGLLYASGTFTSNAGVTFIDSLAIWNGSTWVTPDVGLPGTTTIYGIYAATDGTLYLGFDTTGSALAPVVTTATNNGSARTYPTIYTVALNQSGQAFRVTNYTNGRSIYLNYTLAANEVLMLRCSPTGTRIISSFRGDVTSAILPGSSSDFVLERGANLIAYAMGKPTGRLVWPVAYQSTSDLTKVN